MIVNIIVFSGITWPYYVSVHDLTKLHIHCVWHNTT